MIARARSTPATYDDLCALAPNLVGEIGSGVLHASPRPAFPHAAAASAIGKELGPPFERGKGGPSGWVMRRLDGETYRIVTTFTGDAKVRAEPFDAIELDLAILWAR